MQQMPPQVATTARNVPSVCRAAASEEHRQRSVGATDLGSVGGAVMVVQHRTATDGPRTDRTSTGSQLVWGERVVR